MVPFWWFQRNTYQRKWRCCKFPNMIYIYWDQIPKLKKSYFILFFHTNRPKLPMSYFTKEEKILQPPIIIRWPRPVSTELQKWMVTHPRKRIWTSHEISASGRELCHPRENYEPNWFIDPYLLLIAKLATVFWQGIAKQKSLQKNKNE